MKKIIITLMVISTLLCACSVSRHKYITTIYLDIVNNTGVDEILGREVSEVEAIIRIDGKKVATLSVGEKVAIVATLSKGTHKLKVGLKELSFEVTDIEANTYRYKYLCNLLSYELQVTTEEIVVAETDWIYID